jgi:ring-1,2-phenylacetyl-CoA epoxidase subunit PaaE
MFLGTKNKLCFYCWTILELKINSRRSEIRRAYSICSSPDSDELRIAVKAVPSGAFLSLQKQNLKRRCT